VGAGFGCCARRAPISFSQRGVVLHLFRGFLLRREHAADDRAVQLVSDLDDLAIVIHLADGEGRQVSFLAEILVSDFHR